MDRDDLYEMARDMDVDEIVELVEADAASQREVERLQRMLYTMTSLRDWQLAGYDSAEYDALYAKFEKQESEAE